MLFNQPLDRVRNFIHEHDDLPAFHATFLVAIFLAAAVFNIGFFLALIAVHMALDIIKYREFHGYTMARTLRATLAESLFDITMLCFALALLVYTHHSYGLPLVSGLARSGFVIAVALAELLPKIHALNHLEVAFLHLRSHVSVAVDARSTPSRLIQAALLIVLVASIAVIFAAPALLSMAPMDMHVVLKHQLLPWTL